MNAELMRRLAVLFYLLSAGFFCLSAVLFFTLDIRKIFLRLTGISEKQAVRRLRARNETSTEPGGFFLEKSAEYLASDEIII